MSILLGKESPIGGVIPANIFSGTNVFFAERFTAPSNFALSGMSLSTIVNWDGSSYIGVQANNGGIPDNTYLTSGILIFNSGTAGSFRHVQLLPIYPIVSGTIYHFVYQPSGTIGTGSATTLQGIPLSGTIFWERLDGSLFNCARENNFTQFLSYDSGGTWNTGSLPDPSFPRALVFRPSGAAIGGINEITKSTSLTAASNTLTDTELDGNYLLLDKTYVISGIFTFIQNGGQGSLWCRLEYSGAIVGGLREEIGSVMFTQPIGAGQVSTPEFYTTLNAGSRIYVWLYGSGVQFRNMGQTNAPYTAGAGTFGLGSCRRIASTDAGSTVSFTAQSDVSIWFAASGAAGAASAESAHNLGNSIGGNINYYG